MELSATQLLDHFAIPYTQNGDELRVLCPFHEDTNPSCDVNVDKKVFKCLSCGANGDIISFIAGAHKVKRATVLAELGIETGAKQVPQDLVERWHRDLAVSSPLMDALTRKGIDATTIEKYHLGANEKRITIPIYDDQHRVVNVRQYSPDPKDKKRKVINFKDLGEHRLYPIEALKEKEIWLTEGELKALLLRQRGLNGLCPTGGAGTWAIEWVPLFAGKRVIVVYDIDSAGAKGAQNVARALYTTAEWVKVIKLPIEAKRFPTGDVGNYLVDMGHTAEDLRALERRTEAWRPALLNDKPDDLEAVLKVHLSQSSLAQYHEKLVETEVVISAKDTAPYIIPAKVEVTCDKSADCCVYCPVMGFTPGHAIEIKVTNPVILELVGVSLEQQERALKKALGIPRRCPGCLFKPHASMNVEELRLIPQLKIATNDNDHVVRRAFYVGHGVETNTAYILRSKVVPEPETQYATLLTYEAHASVDSLSTYKLTDPGPLQVFQPEEWTHDSIERHLHHLYADLESNVTRIYQRRDLHLFYDLVYHSPLYIKFQGKVIKGWVEGLVIGDSGQGKSETISRLLDHYRLGEKLDAKGASVAGLLGGLQETSNRWFVSWGVITLNDRRLVVLEEVKGMAQEVIAKLTDMRSSGIAEVSKVEKAKTNARTRLIWISNPRTDRQVMSYNFGVETIKELIGSLEDIRRFDMAIVVASGEVDKSVLNMSTAKRPTAESVYTSDLCNQLILWAWSRKVEEVVIEPEAEEVILKEAARMGDTYSATIPLVEAADQRLKLLRLASALAARTFSTEDGVHLLVRACHVHAVIAFLERVYSSPALGYLQYSQSLAGDKDMRDPDEVEKTLADMPFARDAVQSMLEAKGIMPQDVSDWTQLDKEAARELVGFLVRKNALKRGKRWYLKTPAFIALLKRMTKASLSNKEKESEL